MRKFKIVNVTLDKATIQRAKALATERASTVSALVRDLVRAEWQHQADKINKELEDA